MNTEGLVLKRFSVFCHIFLQSGLSNEKLCCVHGLASVSVGLRVILITVVITAIQYLERQMDYKWGKKHLWD